jgi:hypothetical protein
VIFGAVTKEQPLDSLVAALGGGEYRLQSARPIGIAAKERRRSTGPGKGQERTPVEG